MHPNSSLLLRQTLDHFSRIGDYLYFADVMIFGNDISLQTMCYHKAFLSTDVLVKFVQTAIDSCCAIQDQLNITTKPGCAQELVSVLAQTLIVVRALIILVIKRSDRNINHKQLVNLKCHRRSKSNDHNGTAKLLLEELLNRCPTVSAP